jgi:hypothetical protein
MRPLRLGFSDHYAGFQPRGNRIWKALSTRYRLELTDDLSATDLLVYGDFSTRHWSYVGKKVYLTGENMLPDFDQCDLAFTPAESPDEPRGVRLPLYAQILDDADPLLRPAGLDATHHLDRPGFCSFVVSNALSRIRNRIFKTLHRRSPVASGGRHFNNTGGPVADKMGFLRRYRFNIACENSSSPGYITEKLIDPILAGSIPIYWGAPDVHRDFDPRCMINVSDYESLDDLAGAVLRIDADPEARRRVLEAPVFLGNSPPSCMTEEYVAGPLIDLIENRRSSPRRIRERRIREHVKEAQGPLAYKRDKIICKMESFLWKLGWHR